MNFRRGQQVVCIKRGAWHSDGVRLSRGETTPVLDGVYTIREIEGEFLRFEEIVNKPTMYVDGLQEIGFHYSRFRPLVERKTDISIFTEILDKQKVLA